MKSFPGPNFDPSDLANLLSKNIEVLSNIVSIENLEDTKSFKSQQGSDTKFSPEAVRKLEDKVSRLKISFENDSTILIELPKRKPVEYKYSQLGFRSSETKTWKMFINILSSAPYTFEFGTAYFYPDKNKSTNRQKIRGYDAKWKLLDELNKKLLAFFRNEFAWEFPHGYKLYEYATLGNNGERRFKFIVQPSPSQDHKVCFSEIEKPFLSLDENGLIKKIRQLNNDDDSHELPDVLVAAINVGVENFGWDEKKVLKIIDH
ncbi:MAG: hypothetical protein VYC01_01725 [Nitrospinota bacterium]|nr:hypothetical protein [Nitrospinota bacterium]